jgi:hypothetical protein
VFDHESACDCRPVSFTAFTILELVIVVIATGSIAALLSLAHCYRNSIGFFRHRRSGHMQHRYRSASFRQKVELLSTRFDRSFQGRGSAASPSLAATTKIDADGEELVGLSSAEGRNLPTDISVSGV